MHSTHSDALHTQWFTALSVMNCTLNDELLNPWCTTHLLMHCRLNDVLDIPCLCTFHNEMNTVPIQWCTAHSMIHCTLTGALHTSWCAIIFKMHCTLNPFCTLYSMMPFPLHFVLLSESRCTEYSIPNVLPTLWCNTHSILYSSLNDALHTQYLPNVLPTLWCNSHSILYSSLNADALHTQYGT